MNTSIRNLFAVLKIVFLGLLFLFGPAIQSYSQTKPDSTTYRVYPLLYYKLNPFTKFYIGMTDNLQHVNQFGSPRINGYRQINREFFIKVQYLIRK